MSMTIALRSTTVCAVLAATTCLATIAAAPAVADDQAEYAFVRLMRSRDIDTFYRSRSDMIIAGKAVCEVMDQNQYSWEQTIADVMFTDFIPVQQATFLVRGATTAFCPWNFR